MSSGKIVIRGAREHNLKNIDLEIPRDNLIVITGLSGSGKSSLAFDTLYAEGQRRYVESLSAYARQFLGLMEKPDVDQIEGLSPAISIDQKGASHNPRSTVGTVTEIYDYLRLLFARAGTPHCPNCGRVISSQTVEQIVDAVQTLPEGTRIQILAPLVRDRKGHHQRIFEDIRKAGFVRVRVNGEIRDVNEEIELDRYKQHSIEAVVDRLVVRRPDPDHPEESDQSRLADSIETALDLGDGLVIVNVADRENPRDLLFSQNFACVVCGISLGEIEPRSFSFNTPYGACPDCQGLGTRQEIDPNLVIPNKDLALSEGAIAPWSRSSTTETFYAQMLEALAEHYGFDLDTPWKDLADEARRVVLYGSRGERIRVKYLNKQGQPREYETEFEGVIPNLERRHRETTSDYMRSEIERFMSERPCPTCGGTRLKPEARSVLVAGLGISEVSKFSVEEALRWVEGLRDPMRLAQVNRDNGHGPDDVQPALLTPQQQQIAEQILKEVHDRLGFMADVGLGYLTLDRTANTLSGGEAQRIRLATQIGSQLVGVLYILDEPSIGLHQRDNDRLIRTLERMRDLGNTLIVVEHDEDTMRSADWIVDMGPGAGEHGGRIIASGPLETILSTPESITGRYLAGQEFIPVPARRREGNGKKLTISGARENNLKNISVELPLGKFICITGVSGSGKSTLVVDVLYRRLAQVLHRAKAHPGAHDHIYGVENLNKVINIDQSPIGRTPRSNPATYTNLFTQIRDLYAGLPEARLRGYKPGRFSFNVKGGRCEACQGDGEIKIEMNFLPDIYVKCEVCKGKRYNRETLQVLYKNKSIADALDMTVDEALEFFENIPKIRRKLKTLSDVGLGYIRLGQPAPTLSGGEAQRVKLAKELSRVATGDTIYILDEPTTGLHAADIAKLIKVLNRLVRKGNTVVVIEHNLDMIKVADHVIDMGPEGGDGGGWIIAEGTPEQVARTRASFTGQYLREILDRDPRVEEEVEEEEEPVEEEELDEGELAPDELEALEAG
ncbi:MAG: excinuclease ABC subunit UvrA [Ardenticatenaceae bacterium]|nr:excinuclease ABC subunit UvrA [Ardenticatenaceae bacterium]